MFGEQARKHGLSWYEYANVTRRRVAENGSLYLVTGCDKSVSWGLASFSNSSGGDEVSLKFTAAQIAGTEAYYSYKWDTSSPATMRSGPPFPGHEAVQQVATGHQVAGSRQNQCVLIRGYRISIRPPTLAKLKGPLKVSSVQDAHPNELLHGSKGKGRDIPFAGTSRRSWFANAGSTSHTRVNQQTSDIFSEWADKGEVPSDDTSNSQIPHAFTTSDRVFQNQRQVSVEIGAEKMEQLDKDVVVESFPAATKVQLIVNDGYIH
jgi:hypothetical protein